MYFLACIRNTLKQTFTDLQAVRFWGVGGIVDYFLMSFSVNVAGRFQTEVYCSVHWMMVL